MKNIYKVGFKKPSVLSKWVHAITTVVFTSIQIFPASVPAMAERATVEATLQKQTPVVPIPTLTKTEWRTETNTALPQGNSVWPPVDPTIKKIPINQNSASRIASAPVMGPTNVTIKQEAVQIEQIPIISTNGASKPTTLPGNASVNSVASKNANAFVWQPDEEHFVVTYDVSEKNSFAGATIDLSKNPISLNAMDPLMFEIESDHDSKILMELTDTAGKAVRFILNNVSNQSHLRNFSAQQISRFFPQFNLDQVQSISFLQVSGGSLGMPVVSSENAKGSFKVHILGLQPPVVPQGRMRSTSNPGYAFSETFVSGNEVLKVQNIKTGQIVELYNRSSNEEDLWDVADVSPDGKYAVFTTRTRLGTVNAYIQSTDGKLAGRVISLYQALPKAPGAIRFSGNETVITVQNPDGAFHIDLTSGKTRLELPNQNKWATTSHSDYRYRVVMENNQSVLQIINLKTGELKNITSVPSKNYKGFHLDVSADGETLFYTLETDVVEGTKLQAEVIVQKLNDPTQQLKIPSIVIAGFKMNGNNLEIQRSGEILTIDLKALHIVPPQGWTRAASNPNFAFQQVFQHIQNLSRPELAYNQSTLSVQDLRTGKITQLGTATSLNSGADFPMHDVDAGGRFVVYSVWDYPYARSAPNYAEKYTHLYDLSLQKDILLPGDLKSFQFLTDKQVQLQIGVQIRNQDVVSSTLIATEAKKWTTVDLTTMKAVKEEPIIETAVSLIPGIPVITEEGSASTKLISVQMKLGVEGVYVLESSPNFMTWTSEKEYVIHAPSVLNYEESPTDPQNFFRVRYLGAQMVPIIAPSLDGMRNTLPIISLTGSGTVNLVSLPGAQVDYSPRGVEIQYSIPKSQVDFTGGGINFLHPINLSDIKTDFIDIGIQSTEALRGLKLELKENSVKPAYTVMLGNILAGRETVYRISVAELRKSGLNAIQFILAVPESKNGSNQGSIHLHLFSNSVNNVIDPSVSSAITKMPEDIALMKMSDSGIAANGVVGTTEGVKIKYDLAQKPAPKWVAAGLSFDHFSTPNEETYNFSKIPQLVVGVKGDVPELKVEVIDQRGMRGVVYLKRVTQTEQRYVISMSLLKSMGVDISAVKQILFTVDHFAQTSGNVAINIGADLTEGILNGGIPTIEPVTKLANSMQDVNLVSLGKSAESKVTQISNGVRINFNTKAPGDLNGFAGGGVTFKKNPSMVGKTKIVLGIQSTISRLKIQFVDDSGKRADFGIENSGTKQNYAFSIDDLKRRGIDPAKLRNIFLIAEDGLSAQSVGQADLIIL